MIRRAVVLVVLSLCVATYGACPAWAKPYVSGEVPKGAYISKQDTWILALHDIEVKPIPGEGFISIHREVFYLSSDIPKQFSLAIHYDPETETLSEPVLWIQRRFSCKTIDLKKNSLDAPDLNDDMVTSRRSRYIVPQEIEPGEKVIVTWTVTDKPGSPPESVYWPISIYPCARWSLHCDGAGTAKVSFVKGGKAAPVEGDDGEVLLENLPALGRIRSPSDPWLASPWENQPYIVISRGPADAGWTGKAAWVARGFSEALAKDDPTVLRAKTEELTRGAAHLEDRVCRLALYARDLPYRDIAWGVGAYTPAAPSETLRTLSADCKGKVALLNGLLTQLGVKSMPVLCETQDGYLEHLPVPTTHPFHHVVLAMDVQAWRDTPAVLTDGPGKNWVLFDPTDPLAIPGLPSRGIEGTLALWGSGSGGSLFKVHQSGAGMVDLSAALTIKISSEQTAAGFSLTVKGEGNLLSLARSGMQDGRLTPGVRDALAVRLNRMVSGLKITSVRYISGETASLSAPAVEITGQIAEPLQEVANGTYLLSCAPKLLGMALDLPPSGFRRTDDESREDSLSAGVYLMEPRYCGTTTRLRTALTLDLPEGLKVENYPELHSPIESPWLEASTTSQSPWVVTAAFKRGEFERGSTPQRLNDVNALCALFRQAILIRRSS